MASEQKQDRNQTFAPGPTPNTVRAADGRVLTAPAGWVLLPPGDAALTRRVKAAGDHWVVQEKKGRKVFSRGVWAPAATVERIRAELEAERSTEGYVRRKDADNRRRDRAQAEYVEDFFRAVVTFLGFHESYADLAQRLARAVTDHATPVGSGTVARTQRIPVEQRADVETLPLFQDKATGQGHFQSAVGVYVNFLRVADVVILPAYGRSEDRVALDKMRAVLPETTVAQLPCRSLAEKGVLNCISWAVKMPGRGRRNGPAKVEGNYHGESRA